MRSARSCTAAILAQTSRRHGRAPPHPGDRRPRAGRGGARALARALVARLARAPSGRPAHRATELARLRTPDDVPTRLRRAHRALLVNLAAPLDDPSGTMRLAI